MMLQLFIYVVTYSREAVCESSDATNPVCRTGGRCTLLPAYAEQIQRDLDSFPVISLAGIEAQISAAERINGHHLYFLEVVTLNGEVFVKQKPPGVWLHAAVAGLTAAAAAHTLPNARFILSVYDQPFDSKKRNATAPLFATVGSDAHRDVLCPGFTLFERSGGVSSGTMKTDFESWVTDEFRAGLPSWDERNATPFWRGHNYKSYNDLIHLLDVKEECVSRYSKDMGFSYREQVAFEPAFDAALTGAPAYLKMNYTFSAPVPIAEHAKFRYLLHLDGITFSNRFQKLLLLGSLVFKIESPYREWFYAGLRPEDHYIPFARNRCSLDDLHERVAAARADDPRAKEIAEAGRAFALEHASFAASNCYWYHLLHAYASRQDFEVDSVPEGWIPA
jgi:hypothetical protein